MDSRLRRIAAIAAAEESISVASEAPRDNASIPSAPDPANRSRTRAPSTEPRIENSASRTRSPVGRVALPRGATSVRPPNRPAITRTRTARGSRPDRRRRLGAVRAQQRLGEQRVLGERQLAVLVDDLPRADPRPL